MQLVNQPPALPVDLLFPVKQDPALAVGALDLNQLVHRSASKRDSMESDAARRVKETLNNRPVANAATAILSQGTRRS